MVDGGVLWKAKHRRIKPLILRCTKKTSWECFYAVYVAQAQKLLRVKSKIIVYQRKLFWKFAVERV